MSTDAREITVGGVRVAIVRKSIKNLHLGVYPPHGRVRVAVPRAVSDDAVRLAVIGKLAWIRRQQAQFEEQPRRSLPEMVSGESHDVFGRRYRLRVIEGEGAARVVLRGRSFLELHVQPGTGATEREQILERWYRERLRECVRPLIATWQGVLGVQVADWGIRKMKTRWGSCNRDARRIWLNLELARKQLPCVEYIVVHELAHLRERHHNEVFRAIMDRALPQWRLRRDELNRSSLGHERWGC